MEFDRPLWAQKMLETRRGLNSEKPVKEQLTYLTGPISATAPVQTPARYTGSGVDGVVQPGKMAGQVHEGEGVIPANAMQNLDISEFQAFNNALASGKLNKNAFRQSVGMGPVQGYQEGGLVQLKPDASELDSSLSSDINKTQQSIDLSSTTNNIGNNTQDTGKSTVANNSSILSSTLPTSSTPVSSQNTTAQKSNNSSGGTLLPGLNQSDSNTVMNNARNNASGKNYEPYDIYNTEVLSKAARGLQTTNATSIAKAGLTGQGAANEMIQSTNQGLMENLSTNLLNRQTQKQSMMDQGANQLLSIGQTIENYNQNNKVDTGKRLNTLIAGGSDLTTISNDTLLRNQLAKDLGVDATDEAVTKEIQTLYNASVDTNAGTYGEDAEKLLQDYANSGRTVEEALQDKNIFRKTALSMRLNPDDTDSRNVTAINEEIQRRFADASLNDVDRAVKNVIDSGVITDDIKSVAGWESDLKKMVQDLSTKGFLNADGTIKEGADVEWPWEDPDTYFRYNDFNGNEVDEANYNATGTIDLTDNGTLYKNSNGQAVTNADATAQWDKLNSSEKEKYFTTGSFDREAFMNKYFRTTTTEDGTTVSIPTYSDWSEKIRSDETTAGKIDRFLEEWSTTASYPGKSEEGGLADDALGTDKFLYYDEYGNAQPEEKSIDKLGWVVQQWATKYNKGVIPDAESNTFEDDLSRFKAWWKEGKGWYLDDDGTITNLDSNGTNTVTLKKANDLLSSWSPNQTIVDSDAAAISSQWDSLDTKLKSSETPIDFSKEQMTYYNDGSGKNRWSLKTNVRKWVEQNTGKLWKDEATGRVYEIMYAPYLKGKGSTEAIYMRDITTDRTVEYVNSKHSKTLPQETYYDD